MELHPLPSTRTYSYKTNIFGPASVARIKYRYQFVKHHVYYRTSHYDCCLIQVRTSVLPLVHAPMKNKLQGTYEDLFDCLFVFMKLNNIVPQWTTMLMDYEQAERQAFQNALNRHFPELDCQVINLLYN